MTDPENDRRVTALESRVESIDLHGTRGMEAVRSQLNNQERLLGKLESGQDRLENAVTTIQLTLAKQDAQEQKLRDTAARWWAAAGFLVSVAAAGAAWAAVLHR